VASRAPTAGSFKKGQCGNPKGRPKLLGDVQTTVRGQTQANIARMIELRDQREDPQLALRAAIALHEIAWGKPSQAVQMQGDLTHKADDSMVAFLAQVRKARADA
jgi:hypothetical protein